MVNNILFISGGEIVLVMMLALLFFGAKAIPDIAKTLGKGMREFKKATNEIKREINEHTSDIKKVPMPRQGLPEGGSIYLNRIRR